jgi:spore maturation protein CgeB
MKILYFFEEKNTMMDKWQSYHIFAELKKYGVDIDVFNPLYFDCLATANKALLKRVNDKDFDLFMTPHNETKLFISTLNQIKSLDIPTLLICFDNLVIPFEHKNICHFFDLVWLTSVETEYLFKSWGAKTIFLPYAANPALFKPCGQYEEILKVCFVGTPYGSRVNMINNLTENCLSVDLFSNVNETTVTIIKTKQRLIHFVKPFLNLIRSSYGRKIILGALKNKLIKTNLLIADNPCLKLLAPVNLDKLGSVYSAYALSLSSTSARNTGVLKEPLDIINLRSFEIPMAGGIQVCKYNKELASYFKDGEEIIFYRDNDDFTKKVNFYLLPENSNLRDKIKKAARARAVKEHSWFARFKVIFDYFSIDYEK